MFRSPRTTQERKANVEANLKVSFHMEETENESLEAVAFKVRAKRRAGNLPTSYSDLSMTYQRSWKVYRKTQYKN